MKLKTKVWTAAFAATNHAGASLRQELIGKSHRSIARRLLMQDEPLTADECDELAEVLRQDAAVLANGPKREALLRLSQDYRDLASMKRIVRRKVN